MTSAKERQAVAKALLGDPMMTAIPQTRDGFEGMTYHEAAYRFWDMCRRVKSVANVDIANSTTSVLAELIDPTCHCERDNDCDEPIYGRWWKCDRCGERFIYGRGAIPLYCPHCGARVLMKGESNEATIDIDYTDDFEDVHPCPYCNTMPRITVTRRPNHSVAYVYCPECQTTMTGCSMPYKWYEDVDDLKNCADQDAINDALYRWDHLYRTIFDKDGLRRECLGED
jgi:DNA-directed RNA polymerase subunit RPC12/RpoP